MRIPKFNYFDAKLEFIIMEDTGDNLKTLFSCLKRVANNNFFRRNDQKNG